VGVEKNGRLPGCLGPLAEDGRVPLTGIEDADTGEPLAESMREVNSALRLTAAGSNPGKLDAGDTDQFFQIVEIGRSRRVEVRKGCGRGLLFMGGSFVSWDI